jgi:hypothetical protein
MDKRWSDMDGWSAANGNHQCGDDFRLITMIGYKQEFKHDMSKGRRGFSVAVFLLF